MGKLPRATVEQAEVAIPGAPLDETLAFFTERLGFRVDAVFPADDPRQIVVSGFGVRLRLDRELEAAPTSLRLHCRERIAGETVVAPNGTTIELVPLSPPLDLPEYEAHFEFTRADGEDARWVEGRAGMQYRDLIPSRCGGRFIASHIRVPEGGPVPDYVHYHRVAFQMIYCYRGWVRVVYEDQGPEFVLEAGDCVLQPPEIRHRVLESSDGLEVVEVGCPALHETLVDHELTLPTEVVRFDRSFGGQRFTRHRASRARWAPWRLPGFEARDLGIGRASGRVTAEVVRPLASARPAGLSFDADFNFAFVLEGAMSWGTDSKQTLRRGDAATFARGQTLAGLECTPELELLVLRE
ncbi:MAG: cupin domain-containing protein [Myxococcota bacterium]